ncbi:MAG: hypothetical protein A2020_05685 [Lentisphaerae bacterium GWF2_45_14]|nr:MAG: hypothetical protein A2020_05685 [Lentisphaerae bacterium GWF2_45_14]
MIEMKKSLLFTALLFIMYLLCAKERNIVILQTCDIHGNYSGWLKLASLIKEEKKQENVILIDCGDTFQGNPVSIIDKDNIAAKILNMLGYDVWVPGNHEFDFGSDNILRLSSLIKADTLMANVSFKKSAPSVKSWKIYEKNGIRAAVIGMTFPYLKNSIWGRERGTFEVKSVDHALERIIPEVMDAKPDMIILAVHNGLDISGPDGETLWKTAWKYPQINLILGSHSHREISGVAVGPGPWFAQSGSRAGKLLKVTASVDTLTGKVSFSSFLRDGSEASPDKELSEALKTDFEESENSLAQIIGKTSIAMLPPSGKELNSTMTELIASAIAEASGAQIVFYGAPGGEFSVNAGPLTLNDICRIQPYEDSIGTLELSPSEVSAIIKEQFEKRTKFKHFLYLWGICAQVDSKGNLLRPLIIPGKGEWSDESIRIKTAFGSYDLAGAGNKFPFLKKTASSTLSAPFDTQTLVRDAIRRYISKHSTLTLNKREWLKISNE